MGGRPWAPLLLILTLGAAQVRHPLTPAAARPGPEAPTSISPAGSWLPARELLYRSGGRTCAPESATGPDGYTEYVERFLGVVTRLMSTIGALQRPDGFGKVGDLLFEARPFSPEQFVKIMESLPFKDENMAASIRARVAAGYIGVADFPDTRLGLQDKDAITFLGLSLIRPRLFRDDLRLENRLVHETLHLRYGHDEAKVCAEVSRLS